MRQPKHLFAVFISLLLLQGCGFHLKGPRTVSPLLAGLQVDGYSSLAVLIRTQIAELNATKESSKVRQSTLIIESEKFVSHVLTVDGQGKAIEYELRYQVSFRVDLDDGEALLKHQNLEMDRSYFSSGEDELGRLSEADLLKQDMVMMMSDRILRQLEVQLR
jgi:LPS-assembly lipoprotein